MVRPKAWPVLRLIPTSKLARRFWLRCSWRAEKNCTCSGEAGGCRHFKRVARPMLGFKSFDAAQCTLVGVELMHMLKKGQLAGDEGEEGLTPADQFYALAA